MDEEAETVDAEEPKTPRKKRGSPEGLYVKLTKELRQQIDERCEESFRTPGQEIAWIVRAFLRDDAPSQTQD